MTAVPTLAAGALGLLIGHLRGGRFANLRTWRLYWLPFLLVGGGLQILVDFVDLPGPDGLTTVVVYAAEALLIAFAILNLHVPGMWLVALGLVLNLVPTVLNGGMPVDPDALESAGLVEDVDAVQVEFRGLRVLAAPDDVLVVLGDSLPVAPLKQVISPGDVAVLAGIAVTIAGLLQPRRRRGSLAYADLVAAEDGVDGESTREGSRDATGADAGGAGVGRRRTAETDDIDTDIDLTATDLTATDPPATDPPLLRDPDGRHFHLG